MADIEFVLVGKNGDREFKVSSASTLEELSDALADHEEYRLQMKVDYTERTIIGWTDADNFASTLRQKTGNEFVFVG